MSLFDGKDENTSYCFNDDEVLDDLLYYSIHVEKKSLNLVQRGVKTKEMFLKESDSYMKQRKISSPQRNRVIGKFEKLIWGYHVLEELINDPTISDIKVLNENNVRIKRFGKRMNSHVAFRTKEDYKRFVDLVAVKNKTNLSDLNAIQNFTDKDSNKDFILRFNIVTDFVSSSDVPYLHIRKIPKNKWSLQELKEMNMLTSEQEEYLKKQVVTSSGIIFTGKGASGKTTLMNVLLEEIPHEKSGLIIQENEELFASSHPDLMFQHVVLSRGEGKIQYTLKDLARNGLLTDLDYFVIGEIKGGEALYFLNASYTGHKCWASVHGMSSTEAMDKLADYIKYESDYSKVDILKMLVSMKTIVYLEDFKIKEISEVVGFSKGELVYQRIF